MLESIPPPTQSAASQVLGLSSGNRKRKSRTMTSSQFRAKNWTQIHSATFAILSLLLLLLPVSMAQSGLNYGSGPSGGFGSNNNAVGPNELWQIERPTDMAKIVDLEVMCGKQHMEVQLTFDRPFNGIVFSKGAVDRYDCIYVKPQTGLSQYKFDIMYDSCGSKPDLNGRFYENNIVIQYDRDLIEVWDEAKRLRCEWYNDYEKGVTKPPIRVSDLEVVELNFRGDNVDCWMEIQQGKGPWASAVTGIVPLGTTLTMVVGIDDRQGEFDMRVKSCEASDNKNRPIQLSDGNGCVLRPKMISKFMKMRSTDARATVVTYAFFHAFKFPDSMAVQIRCKVEICRFGCPDHCQNPGSYVAREQEVTSSISSYSGPPAVPPPPKVVPQVQVQSQPRPQPTYNQSPPQNAYSANFYKTNRRKDNPKSPRSNLKTAARPRAPPKLRRRPSGEERRVPTPQKLVANPPSENARSGGQYSPPQPPISRPKAQRAATSPREHYQQYNGPPQPATPQQQRRRQPPPSALRRPPQPNRRIDEEEAEDGGVFGNLLGGFKLPSLPALPKISLPFFGSSEDETESEDLEDTDEAESGVRSEAIKIPLGRIPPADALEPQARRPSAVPVSRSKNRGQQPQVYPSSFNTGNAPVKPIEKVAGPFPYGPRALNVQAIEARKKRSIYNGIRRRTERSADVGVTSDFEVVSAADLAFNPLEGNNEDKVDVLKGRMMNEEIVYGVCLPASGFSALFVLMSLLTVISIIVSGFVCYQRQVQKVQEEEAPRPPPQGHAHPAPMMTMRHAPVHAQPRVNGNGKSKAKTEMPPVMGVPSQMMSPATPSDVMQPRPQPQQMGWGFNTWFKKTRGHRGIPAEMY